jgi:putative serine/threonine protein kinase
VELLTLGSVPLERLCASPYADVICYPKLAPEDLRERLQELKKLRITRIEFVGEKFVHNVPVLGKGCVGIVVKAFADTTCFALKIRRTDADRVEMKHEAEMLEKANSVDVGPKFLSVSKDFVLMEYVSGSLFPRWLKTVRGKQGKARIFNVLRLALEQCWRLDKAGLDHGELSHAPKHVIIENGDIPCIIDFETASTTRRTSNVTSLCQYFFIAAPTAKQMAKKLGSFDQDELKWKLREYKEKKTRDAFEAVLDVVKKAW